MAETNCDGVYPECGPCRDKEMCVYGSTKRKVMRSSDSQSPGSVTTTEARNAETTTSIAQPKAGTPLYASLSSSLKTYLLQTFFNCIHPLWPVLYKPMYSSLDYASPVPLLPAALVSAIFSLTACVRGLPENEDVKQLYENMPEPSLFFEETLMLLQCGDDGNKNQHPINTLKPSITSCQVLFILSLQSHSVAEYARAAMLCGLAAAMAIELRLNRPYGGHDFIQIEIRSRLWWNLFILDKMLSFEMGKPVILRFEDADTPYPSTSEADEFELWMPQIKSELLQRQPLKLRTISVLHTSIELTYIMQNIITDIYGISARKAIRKDQNVGEVIRMKIWTDIKEWERKVEASPLKLNLKDRLSSVPGAITNYVILWSATILLHRPFIERWQSSPAYPDPAVSPHKICFQAANNICMVFEKHADALPGLPCDTIFAIFTAASLFLYHLKQNPVDAETRRRLKLCIHWLSILGNSWKSAGARHQILADLFDLPKELSASRPEASLPTNPVPEASTQVPRPNATMLPPVDYQQTLPQQPLEGWAFLRDFGDSSDGFFALDVEFRDLLDGNFDTDQNGFL
ncbi:hypothetical protein BP5796_03517 [Coleophoma crateriformis]|uniref:Xylanolytic transcriptional activator regulatory domain-containing protein n=1 Tax=Coleophoma crateriformis TaxID=565419 RepID=A0A3D8SNB4_9HELO|nr:hypothetical protein BP5796_03517 [Coleophoma crateriformis]